MVLSVNSDTTRKKLHGQNHGPAEANGNEQGVAQRGACTLRLARADILRAQRGNGREQGGGDEEQEADDFLHDSHSRCVIEAPAVDDDRDDEEGYLNESVLHGNGNAPP